jgi:hypothetical protein
MTPVLQHRIRGNNFNHFRNSIIDRASAIPRARDDGSFEVNNWRMNAERYQTDEKA